MTAKQCVNLFRSETTMHEKAHLAAAFPEVVGACRTEPFQPYLLEQFLPVRGIDVQTGLDQGVIDTAFAQFRPDLLRPLAALEAGMDERLGIAGIAEQALCNQRVDGCLDDLVRVAAGRQFARQFLFAVLAARQQV